MADNDPEVATKAPESDAAASQSLVPGDTPAQTGAAMGVSSNTLVERYLGADM